MSVKNNAIVARSWLFFILVFGGIIGLLIIALVISRWSDSNNNDKKIEVKSNTNKSDVVKSITSTGCGCGGGKQIEEKKKQAQLK